jgi:predicted GH43/DUF377 family glycosyl hydrolase
MSKVLGVLAHKGDQYLYREFKKNRKITYVAQKKGGSGKKALSYFSIKIGSKLEDLKKVSNLIFSNSLKEFFLFYNVSQGKKQKLCFALGKNNLKFKKVGEFSQAKSGFALNKKLAFLGFGSEIKLVKADKKNGWSENGETILRPRHNFFDSGEIQVAHVIQNKSGIFLFYLSAHRRNGHEAYDVGLAKFDKKNPGKLISRSETPLWEQPDSWDSQDIVFVGISQLNGELKMFWRNKNGISYEIHHPEWDEFENFLKPVHFKLKRHHKNPIIVPHGKNFWETKATFNPAAVYLGGRVHLLYRAIGESDVSVLGYASSEDGYHFDLRLDEPAYVPREWFEGRPKGTKATHKPPEESPYQSGGGGWGGCEDPRVTHIGDRVYLTYVAYSGWSEPRVALSSISVEDFLNKNWNWTDPVLISRPGEINKNACIMPEKINGKYVIFHRVFPDILIDFVDDLNFDGKNKFLKTEARIKPRRKYWDSRKVGIGPPPIKTDYGWLVIYQGVGEQDPGRYKIGAMLLDLNNPAKVIARASKPILEPEEYYENGGWKHGVVYPCGAVVISDMLFVYYGGADAYVGVAAAKLDDFLKTLVGKKSPKVEKISSVIIDK